MIIKPVSDPSQTYDQVIVNKVFIQSQSQVLFRNLKEPIQSVFHIIRKRELRSHMLSDWHNSE